LGAEEALAAVGATRSARASMPLCERAGPPDSDLCVLFDPGSDDDLVELLLLLGRCSDSWTIRFTASSLPPAAPEEKKEIGVGVLPLARQRAVRVGVGAGPARPRAVRMACRFIVVAGGFTRTGFVVASDGARPRRLSMSVTFGLRKMDVGSE
jgi:hypothetical protein